MVGVFHFMTILIFLSFNYYSQTRYFFGIEITFWLFETEIIFLCYLQKSNCSFLVLSWFWLVLQSHSCNLQVSLYAIVLGIYCSLSFKMFLVNCIAQNTWLLVQIVLYLLKILLFIYCLLWSIHCCIPR